MTVQNNEALRLWLWLTQAEKGVRKAIRQSDAPFLGLLGETLTEGIRSAITKALVANPGVEGYVQQLAKYPALFAVNLTSCVMCGMGQGGHFALYPHIRSALGMHREPSQAERD